MKCWKRLGALLLAAVLIVGLCQVPGKEAKATAGMPYITDIEIKGDKREFEEKDGKTSEKFILADDNPIMIDPKTYTIYFVYESLPDYPDVVEKKTVTYEYELSSVINIKATEAGQVASIESSVKITTRSDRKTGKVKRSRNVTLTAITPDGTWVYPYACVLVSETDRPKFDTKFDGKNPQITSMAMKQDQTINGVAVKEINIIQNELTDEQLNIESVLEAGTIDIVLTRDLVDGDNVGQVQLNSVYYTTQIGIPNTYKSANILTSVVSWEKNSQELPYLELKAVKADGTTEQTFRYKVKLNIAAHLYKNSENSFLNIDGFFRTDSDIVDVADGDETMTITTAKYLPKLSKLKVRPHYAAGAFLVPGSVIGGIANDDGTIIPDDLNRRGLSFTIKNAMDKPKTYSIQVNTPWALQWTDSVNPQIKKILKNGTEQTKDLVKQGNWSTDTLEANSTVEVQLTPPETGQVLNTVVLKTSDGQAVEAACENGSFSFKMPNDVVTIESLNWKKGDYYPVTTSAKDVAGEIIDSKYETATIQVNEKTDIMAAAKDKVAVTPKPGETHPYYQYELDHWDYNKSVLIDANTDPVTSVLTFTMPEQEVAVKAVYKKVGTEMTFRLKGPEGGSLTAGGYRLEEGGTLEVTDTYRQGAELTLRLFFNNTTGYRFDGWKNASGVIWDEKDSSATWADASTDGIPYREPTITVGTEHQTWVAEFKAKAFGSVQLCSEDENKGTVTGTYKGTPGTIFGTVFEGEEVSLKATAKDGYLFDHWTAVDDAGNTITVLDGKGAEVTLTRETGDDKNLTITAVFKVNPNYKSPLCDITDVELLDKDGKVVRGMTAQEGTTLTIGLTKTDMSAEDAEGLNQDGKYFLKITHSDKATVAHRTLDDAHPSYPDLAWNKGNVTCPIAVNSLGEKFVVTAENGTQKTYTIKITYESEKPVISDVSAERTSDTEAKVTFTSDTKGNYFYLYKKAKEEAPTQDEVLASKLKGSIGAGSSQTLNLKALSNTVYKVYLVVKGNMNGSMPSDVMEIDVPKLGSYKIGNVCSTSGGTVTIDKKRADAREKITVTVTPKAGMKLDSLTYSTDLLGSAPVSILDKKVSEGVYVFDMPTANITIGCTWSKTSETDGPTITGFVINGTSGTISQSAGTIKITMPYGTDLTSLKPEITLQNVVSVSPASGTAVNLSGPVTYTVTAEDGTTKTYTVTATVAAQSTSDKLWEGMLDNVGGSTDHSGKNTWWEKAKDKKKHNNYPTYW